VLSDLLDALEELAEEDLTELLEDIMPDELKDLCRYKQLIRLLLDLCPE